MTVNPLQAWRRLLLAAIIAAPLAGPATESAKAEELSADKSQLIRSLLPTVVNITVRKQEPANNAPADASAGTSGSDSGTTIKTFVGSGFVIDPSGQIVTNYHVIENAFEITVIFSNGERLPGRVLSASRLADLALVKVDADHPLPAAHWGNSDLLQVGDQVFAAGNPFGIGLSVSAGIVSAVNRDIHDTPYDDYIQTDATINHGNSGGPLFDMQGDVVGVDSTIISPTTGSSGLGFAIPANSAHFVIDQLRAYGWVRPGWIGIKVQTVTTEIADALGLAQPQGAIVSWVLPDAPAAKAGLAIGDIIERYNGSVPSDERALLRDITHTPVGDTITLTVRRGAEERDVLISVEAWPRNQWEARDAPQLIKAPKIIIPHDLGLSLSAIDAGEKTKLGLENGLNGVLVKGIASDSDPELRGMQAGDVILRVQDDPVATPAEVQSGIDAARAARRDFVLMLVLPKVRTVLGPKWVVLRLNTSMD
jgi:serine protease Do